MYKLSIVIPVYKVEDYLCGCLDSVYSQAGGECQVILIDDGSPDNCGKICDEYAEKYPEITTVIHQENMGNGVAKNRGIECAEGEYIFFIDSDDSIEPNAVATLFEAIDKFGADVILFGSKSVTETGEVLSYSYDPYPANSLLEISQNKSLFLTSPSPWNRITKTSLFRDNGILFASGVWYEDIRTTVKVLGMAKTAVYLDKSLYNYLRRSGSIMNNKNVERNREIIDAMDDLLEFFKSRGIYEKFRDELEYIIIDHVLVSATVRVLRTAPPSHPLVDEFRRYTMENCRTVTENPYVEIMPKNRKVILILLLRKLYLPVMAIFRYIKK